jgi:S1-C subfamily serine protease
MAKLKPSSKHLEVLYPTVRVRAGSKGGSGTVLWSQEVDDEFVTFVLTNHHVIVDLIEVKKEYDPRLGREMPKETRGTAQVEFFRYKDGSRAIGTYSVDADVVTYSKSEDLALLRLRDIEQAKYVAKLPPPEKVSEIRIFDACHAVGASLGHAPIATDGSIVSMDDEIKEKEYWMTTAQTIFGNSGGAIFLADTHEFIGVPSMISVSTIGWAMSAITHMGYFIPFWRVYDWLEEEYYNFIYDESVSFEQCDKDRVQAKEDQTRLLDVRAAQELPAEAKSGQYYKS